MKHKILKTILLASFCFGLTLSQSYSAEPVGAVKRVIKDAYGTVPKSEQRKLNESDNIVRNEFLETVDKGGLTVVFIDGTSFHLGSNSTATVDDFVFSEDKQGNGLLELGEGVFRFISNGENEQIKFATTTSVIGVRGTDFVVRHAADGSTTVGTVSGLVDVTSKINGDQALVYPGQYVNVNNNNSLRTRSAPVRINDFACWLTRDSYLCSIDSAPTSSVSVETDSSGGHQNSPEPSSPDANPSPDPDPGPGDSGDSDPSPDPSPDGDHDAGHGNDPDGSDPDNPGNSTGVGGPNGNGPGNNNGKN